jgi:hypothetical protein
MCHSPRTPTTTASIRVNDHHEAGSILRERRPSAVSSRCSAHRATAVPRTAVTIATNFSGVGEVVKRVSSVASRRRPSGVAPVRSENTPTICGRRSRSKTCSTSFLVLPVIAAVVCAGSDDTVTAQTPPSRPVTGALRRTVFRTVTSTRSPVTRADSAQRSGSAAPIGAVDTNAPPPDSAKSPMAEQGIVSSNSVGVYDTRGAVTAAIAPPSGHEMRASVC